MHLVPLPATLSTDGFTWRAPLPRYQQVGIARLLAEPGVLLADEMGLGKTIQAIGALRVLLQRGAQGPALVVVPTGLVLQWRRQLREWAPELTLSTCIGAPEERRQRWSAPAQVYLTGFDALRGDMALPTPYGPRRRLWQVVVADEAQRIKNAHTAIAATVKALPRCRAWALTGTPLENRPDDAVSILDFVAPGLCDPTEMVAGLRKALSLVQLRRRRADVLPELPPKTVFEIAPDLLPDQRAAYDIAQSEGLVWLRSLGAELRVNSCAGADSAPQADLQRVPAHRCICQAQRSHPPAARCGRGRPEGLGVHPVRCCTVRCGGHRPGAQAAQPAAADRPHVRRRARRCTGTIRRRPEPGRVGFLASGWRRRVEPDGCLGGVPFRPLVESSG